MTLAELLAAQWAGEPWPLDTRVVLKEQIKRLEARGYTFFTGLEPEFSLLKKDADPVRGLKWMRSKVSLISEHLRRYVQLRYLPKLEFVHDESPDRAERVLNLLDQLGPAPADAKPTPPQV